MHFKTYKTILQPNGVVNLYRGCSHGCIYCDSRSRCYDMRHSFEDIEVKNDAPEILSAQLASLRRPRMINFGSMCDPYLYAEEKLRLTRRALEAVAKTDCGVTVLTKSALILRDSDVLEAIDRRSKAVAQMTLTTFDDNLTRVIEPNASSTRRRFEALAKLRVEKAVWLCPLLPLINDTEENLRGIIEYCRAAGVKKIVSFGFGLTLRAGSREYFYSALEKFFPGLKEEYIRLYGYSYYLGSPNSLRLNRLFHEECERYKIDCDTENILRYLQELPRKTAQLSFL